jgi:hypothetical protein
MEARAEYRVSACVECEGSKENMVNVCEYMVRAEYVMGTCRARCDRTHTYTHIHTHAHTHSNTERHTCSEIERTRV